MCNYIISCFNKIYGLNKGYLTVYLIICIALVGFYFTGTGGQYVDVIKARFLNYNCKMKMKNEFLFCWGII